MSRRGNCYDNALAENFFGILKTECIYRHKPETFEQANKMIDDYIHFYNHERIQLKNKKRMDRRIKFICPFGLAEQQGFEPWHPFRGLRDFESRLFDHLSTAPHIKLLERAERSGKTLERILGENPQKTP